MVGSPANRQVAWWWLWIMSKSKRPGYSNLWLKEQDPVYDEFQWQGGYADFSVSLSNLESVENYIINQEMHHRKLSFQDELRALLRKHNVDWDERYVWD